MKVIQYLCKLIHWKHALPWFIDNFGSLSLICKIGMTFRHTTVTQIFSLFTIIIMIIIIISTHWLVVAVRVFIFFTRLLQRYFYGLIFVLPCFEMFTPLLSNILTHSFTYFSCVKFTNSRYRSERKRLATISVKMRTTNERCERLENDQKIFLNLPETKLSVNNA